MTEGKRNMTRYLTVIIGLKLQNSIMFPNVTYSGSNKSTVNYSTDVNMKLQFASRHTAQKTATRSSFVMTS
jgi:hypothetical protein